MGPKSYGPHWQVAASYSVRYSVIILLTMCASANADHFLHPAVPHKVTQDDEYNGYHIPAGALVVGNVWYAKYRYFLLRTRAHDSCLNA